MLKYVAAVLVLAVSAQNIEAQPKVQVSVYYEALCPDSIKFFTKQLYPTLQRNVSKYIDLTLVPFGKATQTFDQNLAQWKFECHHGPNECYGNKIQACAIHRISGGRPSQNLGYNKITVAFINCLMDKVNREPFDLPVRDCATMNNVQNFVDISNCANHTDGSSLLANLGHITEKLSPKLTSVPTIVFNNNYNKEEDQMAQMDFQKALCDHITEDKPAECMMNSADQKVSTTFVLGAIASLMLIQNIM